ncbi:hypothetical protein [Guggenheimella bovis]
MITLVTHIADFEKTYLVDETLPHFDAFLEALHSLAETYDIEVYEEGKRGIGYYEGSGIRENDQRRFESFTLEAERLLSELQEGKRPRYKRPRTFSFLRLGFASLCAFFALLILSFITRYVSYGFFSEMIAGVLTGYLMKEAYLRAKGPKEFLLAVIMTLSILGPLLSSLWGIILSPGLEMELSKVLAEEFFTFSNLLALYGNSWIFIVFCYVGVQWTPSR